MNDWAEHNGDAPPDFGKCGDPTCEECNDIAPEQVENEELTKIIDALHEENRKLRYLNDRLFNEAQGVPCYEGGFIQLIVAIRRTYHGLSLVQARNIQKEVARMAKEFTQ